MELCVALDLPSYRANMELAHALQGLKLWLKVGLRSYIRDGKEMVRELQALGFPIFLDLKLHDIPNTMADAAEEIAQLGVDLFNLHASAGRAGMEAVMERLASYKRRPRVLAVTALTSWSDQAFQTVYGAPIRERAIQWAKEAYAAGLDGVVSSVFESRQIKEATSPNFITLAPGIRPFGEASHDQKRVANIEKAKEEEVDFIVVGRPIYQARDPRSIAQKILTKLEN
ncbi:MAG: orotidine-5'-phosphate decarboxylase [Nitratiruptor sp.]|nr:orotidine-5'-phosphate decarboxylase [Nitratiruptor sp.]NPA84338.1 orotidine-5'-phosphate decarboxylase [Campylobacterota bacterium]